MVNPNKIVRKAVIDSLRLSTGIGVYENSLPIDIEDEPKTWITIHSQSKKKTEQTKTCFDWNCQITIDIFSEQEKGFSSQLTADDLEGIVLTDIEVLRIPSNSGHVKDRTLLDSVSSLLETPDKTINRITVKYEIWLSQVN